MLEVDSMRRTMPAKQRKHAAAHKNTRFGLLANGACAPWEIAIDEAISGPDRWWLQMESPAASFYFEIPSLNIVTRMARFLESRLAAANQSPNGSAHRNGSLVLGKDKKSPVILIKDDEYADRFFLVIGPKEHPVVRFILAGMDVEKIAGALRQVQEDLE
jgi:hypothetical protein